MTSVDPSSGLQSRNLGLRHRLEPALQLNHLLAEVVAPTYRIVVQLLRHHAFHLNLVSVDDLGDLEPLLILGIDLFVAVLRLLEGRQTGLKVRRI